MAPSRGTRRTRAEQRTRAAPRISACGGMHPYAYLGNDPRNGRDPSGLTGCLVREEHGYPGTNEHYYLAYWDPDCLLPTLYVNGMSGLGRMMTAEEEWAYVRQQEVERLLSRDEGREEDADWGECGRDLISTGISAAGDAAFGGGGRVALNGVRAIARGRAGLQRVALRQVRTGRGALKRRSKVRIQGGRSMVGVGGSTAAAAWAGDGTLTAGLEQTVLLEGDDPDTSVWEFVPFVGTVRNAWGAARSCYSAARAQFGSE